jgi:hypothetical protein
VRVLHVITGLGVGGAELQLKSILQHTRHNADVVTLDNPGPVAEMIRAGGNRVTDLGMTRNTQLSALRDALAIEVRAGQRDRLPEPAVEKTYGIQAVTNRIDDLYEQIAARNNVAGRGGGRGLARGKR